MPALPPRAENPLAAFAAPFTQENRLVRLRFSGERGIASDTLSMRFITPKE